MLLLDNLKVNIVFLLAYCTDNGFKFTKQEGFLLLPVSIKDEFSVPLVFAPCVSFKRFLLELPSERDKFFTVEVLLYVHL